MMAWIRRWKARRAHEKQLRECREDGHNLIRTGELTPGKMVGGSAIPVGKPHFWLFACKCGYGEVNDVGTASPYRRPFDEGLRLMEEAKKEK